MQEWISSEYPIFQPEATEPRHFPSDLCRSVSVDHKSNRKQFGLASTDLASHTICWTELAGKMKDLGFGTCREAAQADLPTLCCKV